MAKPRKSKQKVPSKSCWEGLIKLLCKKLKETNSSQFKIFQNCRHAEGHFYSRKNRKRFIFRSSYEFAYFYLLEHNDRVVQFESEPFEITYYYGGKKRTYWPDIMVLYEDGSLRLHEVKPKRFLSLPKVKAKALAARKYLNEYIPGAKFGFVTENDIFGHEDNFNLLTKYANS